ncbi:MAG TPA: hypothetical protein VGP21_07385, partial [Opitutaceae bacterium]|nr:hypothetical protein [Opitutaceae bacterium]
GLSARWEFVMRNRSATVAGFHGLSWFPKVSKERQELFSKLKQLPGRLGAGRRRSRTQEDFISTH